MVTSFNPYMLNNPYLNRPMLYRGAMPSYNMNLFGAVNQGQYNTDRFVSINGETCTDGKDDGSIGLWEGICNVAKGAVNTVGSAVKGFFCDDKGDFSLTKTAKSLGMAAACTIFHPLGLLAGAYGLYKGGTSIISNGIRAYNATTDAEKKLALQGLGSGALIAGASWYASKASYNAMQKQLLTADKLGTVAQNASKLAKVQNFGKNLWESTKLSWQRITPKNSAITPANGANTTTPQPAPAPQAAPPENMWDCVDYGTYTDAATLTTPSLLTRTGQFLRFLRTQGSNTLNAIRHPSKIWDAIRNSERINNARTLFTNPKASFADAKTYLKNNLNEFGYNTDTKWLYTTAFFPAAAEKLIEESEY